MCVIQKVSGFLNSFLKSSIEMNRRSKKKKNINSTESNSSTPPKSPQSLKSKKDTIGDPFQIPCRQVDKIIDSSPMDENDRSDLKNGLMSFYEAIKLLLNDINTNSNGQITSVNFAQLIQGWNSYKTDLINSLKSPKRTDYITYVHNELLKIGITVDRLLDHPPITPQFRVHGPKLIELLATQTTNVLTNFRKLFDELLTEDQISIESIDNSRNPLRKFRQELLKKYQIFFLTDNKDNPNDLYANFLKYFDRVLKKTQHFSVSHSDEIPIPIQQIDKSLDKIQKVVENNDMSDENKTKTPLNFDFTTDSASYIRNNLQQQFDATSSATGLSIYNFNLQVSEVCSQVTGLDSFFKKSNIGGDQRSFVTSMRDKARLNAKWYKMPLFEALDATIKKLDERAAMIAARFTEDQIEKKGELDDVYGEKDEIEKQIANSMKRTNQTKERHSKQENKLNSLMKSIDAMMNDFLPNSKLTHDTPLNLQKLKFDFSTEKSVISHLEKLRTYIKKRKNELTQEKSELIEDDIIQKTTGSAMFDEETAITQAIIKQHEEILWLTKELKIDNLRLKAENEQIENENFVKQGQCNDISEKIDILNEKIIKLKRKFEKKNTKIEWLSAEIQRLQFENEHMNEIEQKNKERFEEKIMEVIDETKKLTKLAHRLPQILLESKNKNNEMEKVAIPELSYKLEKLAGIVRFQTRQALIDKQKTKNLQIHALSNEVNSHFLFQKQINNSNLD